MTERVSAGIVLYRRQDRLEVLLGHPGGPRFAARDAGVWSIPKGEVEAGEDLEMVARREFEEETGHPLGASRLVPLGQTVQKGGKRVHAWAVEGDLDPTRATSNTYVTEWPKGSGQWLEVPEIDRVAWFEPASAKVAIKPTQVVFIERLQAALAAPGADDGGPAAKLVAPLIAGVHAIVFSPAADEVRAFFRDTLGLTNVDAGGGWLIFALPPAELAVHPDEAPRHELYLMTDDLDATVEVMGRRGVMVGPISEQRWGRVTTIALAGGTEIGLYEPRHPRPTEYG